MEDYSGSEFDDSSTEEAERELYRQFYFGESTASSLESTKQGSFVDNDCDNASSVVETLDDIRSQKDSAGKIAISKNFLSSTPRLGATARRERVRTDSICSIESVSGKTTLDDLYCEIPSDENIVNLLKSSTSENEESDADESKCSVLKKAAKKRKKHQSSKKEDSKQISIIDLEESDEAEGIQVLPTAKNKKTLSLVDLTDEVEPPKSKEITLSSDEEIEKYFSDSSEDMDPNLSIPMNFNISSFCRTPVSHKVKEVTTKKPKCAKLKVSDAIYTRNRPLSTKSPSCPKWTQEMTSFYDSDVSDDFSVELIHSMQSDDPAKWRILRIDTLPRERPRYFNRLARCVRCREFGHLVSTCTKVPLCPLCGSGEHSKYTQCPQNCCMRCGKTVHKYCHQTANDLVCNFCSFRGHAANLCPDTWRRFHLTTQGTTPVKPKDRIQRDSTNMFCYNCARKGHFGHQCRTKNIKSSSRYAAIPRHIHSYRTPKAYSKPEKSNDESTDCVILDTMEATMGDQEALNSSSLGEKSPLKENTSNEVQSPSLSKKKTEKLKIKEKTTSKTKATMKNKKKNANKENAKNSNFLAFSLVNTPKGNLKNFLDNFCGSETPGIGAITPVHVESRSDGAIDIRNDKSCTDSGYVSDLAKRNLTPSPIGDSPKNIHKLAQKIEKESTFLQKGSSNSKKLKSIKEKSKNKKSKNKKAKDKMFTSPNLKKSVVNGVTVKFKLLKGSKAKYYKKHSHYIKSQVKQMMGVNIETVKDLAGTKSASKNVTLQMTGSKVDLHKAVSFIGNFILYMKTTSKSPIKSGKAKITDPEVGDSPKSVCAGKNGDIKVIIKNNDGDISKKNKKKSKSKKEEKYVTIFHELLPCHVPYFKTGKSRLRKKVKKLTNVELSVEKDKKGLLEGLSLHGTQAQCNKAKKLVDKLLRKKDAELTTGKKVEKPD